MTRSFRNALLAASLMTGLGTTIAVAQPANVTTNATTAQQGSSTLPSTPSVTGKVAQYSLTPRGDVDGLILDNGTEVHFPPPNSTLVVYSVKPGDSVTVRGLKAAAVPMIQATSITNDATGQTIAMNGPPGPPGGPHGPHGRHGPGGPAAGAQALQVSGTVKEPLHGPRGDLNGVLLDNGAIVHLPPPEAQRLAADLAPGKTVYASGWGVHNALGEVIAANAIGPSQSQAVTVASPPPPPHGPRGGPDAPPPPPPPSRG